MRTRSSTRRRVCALLLCLALACLPAAADTTLAAAATSSGNAIKRATSFVTPTFGSSRALTLSTYLTDAADLHYAVVPSGHAPLDASAIKNAAEQCNAIPQPLTQSNEPANRDPRRSPPSPLPDAVSDDRLRAAEVTAASTVTVAKAQKVERVVDSLQPNTSYDVYFVAEVSGSNGVFGAVQSVLLSTTHSEPPVIAVEAVAASNASATTLKLNATLSAPGRVYFAFAASSGNKELSTAEIVSASASAAFGSEPPVVFAQHDESDWTQLSFFKTVEQLTSATLYDVFLVAEALGAGGVRSDVVCLPRAARTHALPPDVVRLVASPQDASPEALVVEFDLRFDPQDVRRANAENLESFTFNMHYEALQLAGTSESKSATPVESGSDGSAASQDGDGVVRGIFTFGNFSSLEQLQEQLGKAQHGVIPHLRNGTSYRVTLVAETASSSGLFGEKRESAAPCSTHERAPRILAASAKSVNGSVDALVVTAEMERSGGGNVHYLVVPRGVVSVRNFLHEAKSMEHLVELVRGGREDIEVVFGKIEYDPRSASSSDPSSDNHAAEFHVNGLQDATMYSVALLPEAHMSNGVFGKPFEQLIDAQTNENASAVALHAAEPVFGSTSSIELVVEMSKPNDVLYYCLSSSSSDSEFSQDSCLEANRSMSQPMSSSSSFPRGSFSFAVSNLTEDTAHRVSVFAENVQRNQVFSAASAPELLVKTHKRAPALVRVQARPIAAFTDRIATSLVVEETCLVHYAIIEAPVDEEGDEGEQEPADSSKPASVAANETLPSPESIIKDKWMLFPPPSNHHAQFVAQGRLFARSSAVESFSTAALKANTTYTLFLTTETSLNGNTSGVYGQVQSASVSTFAIAPKIIKATVDPTADRTDSVFITANLSAPGIVHYFFSDIDFADPAVIRKREDVHEQRESADNNNTDAPAAVSVASSPHVLRGEFYVRVQDMAMEIINGTNDSKPVEPLMFVNNLTVSGLRSGATYHVSFTTETFASGGVFGEFPPPILVMTHLAAPKILPATSSAGAVVRPKDGSSSVLSIELELSRFGEVHYALFFRGLIRDHSDAIFEEQRRLKQQEVGDDNPDLATENARNATNATEPEHVWPPVTSDFSLAHLNASLLKVALFDDLGPGVWDNGTISVSREDVLKGKLTVKEISKLPPNAIFDVCLVSETAGSDGIFDWTDADSACRRVQTHADYSNQSMLLDEISIQPIDGQTGSVRIELAMSKLLGAPVETAEYESLLERFAVAAGRVPYFILADGKEVRKEFQFNSFGSGASRGERERVTGFKAAVPGSNGVAAAGMLTQIRSENTSFLVLSQEIRELKANQLYLLFFAYETSGSDGVYTKVNPHKHRSNDSKTENDGIEVVTHEAAPVLTKFATLPTFGNTSVVTIKFDILCASCAEAIVHALVYPEVCGRPSIELLRGSEDAKSDSIAMGLDGSESADEPATLLCRSPLARRRFVVDMGEREHKMINVERDVAVDSEEGSQLQPNTTYKVFLATETANSSGVLSDSFIETSVTTFALAPAFKYIRVAPRKGSTTEILLEFELERPGEVHYMAGVSGNPELNVTSPYNVSRRGRPEKNAPKVHDYARDVVRLQRSVKIERAGEKHVEVLDYLVAGTSYDVFVVAESLENNGIYGDVLEFPQVATHANPPILLAHSAYPTPGSKTSLTVGFRMDAPGSVHFSVVAVNYWSSSRHVARDSDFYGNRLAIQEQLVTQETLVVDDKSMSVSSSARDSGWREINISVPQPGANYTVYLVTETAASDGVFGTVASHRNVRSHGDPPTALKLSVTAADARVDALKAHIQITTAGHVHYIVLPHHRRLSERPNAAVAQGVVEVNAVSGSAGDGDDASSARLDGAGEEIFETAFVIEQLKEGTVYDIYFRCETLHSFGVFGSWTHFPISARTHGLPPDVLEEVECTVTPSCDAIGRESCARTANVCGECLDGFSGAEGSSNEPCRRADGLHDSSKKKKIATIKISGVRVNPLAWLEAEEQLAEIVGVMESELQPLSAAETDQQQQLEGVEVVELEIVEVQPESSTPLPASETGPPPQQQEVSEDDHASVDGSEEQHEHDGGNQTESESQQQEGGVLTVEVETPETSGRPDQELLLVELVDDESSSEVTKVLVQEDESGSQAAAPLEPAAGVKACPMHAEMVAPGQCECRHGYAFNAATSRCESVDEAEPSTTSVLESPLHHSADTSRSI